MKSILVTGASRGLGKGISQYLDKEGHRVIATGRDTDSLQTLADHGNSIEIFTADISTAEGIDTVVQQGIQHQVDVVINNAGFGVVGKLKEISRESLLRILETNLVAPIEITKGLRNQIAKKQGSFGYITSLAGKMGFPDMISYSASKFGLEGAIESLRYELEPLGIGLTVVRPGMVDTDFFDTAGLTEQVEGAKSDGLLKQPEEIAQEICEGILTKQREVVIGSDKDFLRRLPNISFDERLKVLGEMSS
ncbi:SDR family NAD(P)-dependent oxidoreductase [Candidatus Peregrinibacteria bacterium]|nr:MAG: SDR family NAD(P)-dependent oxidoreductase [Candidatus Peregrinibacteria bacterium]